MTLDTSVNWFLAQLLAAIAAYLIGRSIGKSSTSWGEISLLCVTVLTIGWALRRQAEDALLLLVPLDLLVYTEGTIIVPFFTLLAGVLTERGARMRPRRLGPLVGAFGLLYLLFNGMWMLSPRVEIPKGPPVTLAAGVVAQTRSDTCVAAALATALRSPGINVMTTEAEMARLADVRVGQGATMLRALRAARTRLAGTDVLPRLHSCSPDQAVAAASHQRPVLVSLRTGLRQTHMVAVLGRTSDGDVLFANSWIPLDRHDEGLQLSGVAGASGALPTGLASMPLHDFARLYTGGAIIFGDRTTRRIHVATRH